jgi:hypothetical protein
MESKDYSWRRMTDSGPVSHGPLELVWGMLVADNNNGQVYLRNGEDTSAEIAIEIRCGSRNSRPIAPKVPIYLDKGLYLDVQSGTSSVFLLWREL